MMELFTNAHPDQENAGEYYDGIEVNCYDEFIKKINFIDPYHVAKVIADPAPAENV